MQQMASHLYCPKCKELVAVIVHRYPNKIQYVCSKCGFVIEVKHTSFPWREWKYAALKIL